MWWLRRMRAILIDEFCAYSPEAVPAIRQASIAAYGESVFVRPARGCPEEGSRKGSSQQRGAAKEKSTELERMSSHTRRPGRCCWFDRYVPWCDLPLSRKFSRRPQMADGPGAAVGAAAASPSAIPTPPAGEQNTAIEAHMTYAQRTEL